eukprot:763446-Hanusia_phi.AAC.1
MSCEFEDAKDRMEQEGVLGGTRSEERDSQGQKEGSSERKRGRTRERRQRKTLLLQSSTPFLLVPSKIFHLCKNMSNPEHSLAPLCSQLPISTARGELRIESVCIGVRLQTTMLVQKCLRMKKKKDDDDDDDDDDDNDNDNDDDDDDDDDNNNNNDDDDDDVVMIRAKGQGPPME